MSQKTVSVNGTVYDKRTGMPLRLERPEIHSKSAQQVHRSVQKSTTLNRRYVSRDARPAPRAETVSKSDAPAAIHSHHRTVQARASSPATGVTHFAPTHKPAPQRVISDIGPVRHKLTDNVVAKTAKAPARVVKPSHVLKQEAIAHAMAQTPAKGSRAEVSQPRNPKMKRFVGVASASLAILLLGGYFTYLSMPALSTRVAATQAGIAASYPGYQPSGYSLSGPVAYQQGKVTMTFAANAGPATYTLEQTKSGWDSSAVLDGYVAPQAGADYETTTSNGLTIYTYANHAAWVNRGIFYTISGDAPLSNDQIQRIATSL
jgi:preprotein translocase subunit SecD